MSDRPAAPDSPRTRRRSWLPASLSSSSKATNTDQDKGADHQTNPSGGPGRTEQQQLILAGMNRTSSSASISSLSTLPLSSFPHSHTHNNNNNNTSHSHSHSLSPQPPPTPAFGKMSLSSMINGLSLSRTSTRDDTDGDKKRGRASTASGTETPRSRRTASLARSERDDADSNGDKKRARSSSPFRLRLRRGSRSRPSSPEPGPLAQSDYESGIASGPEDDDAWSAADDHPSSSSGYYGGNYEGITDDEDDDEDDDFDPETVENTAANSRVLEIAERAPEPEDGDPLGEGPNVVIPPEPYFPTTLNGTGPNATRRVNPKRRKSMLARPDPLPLNTARPTFARDRATIVMRHGDPAGKLAENGRRPRKYVVASDMSEESRYAVEWGIGTVLRDGDEMLIVHVNENESKVDPEPSAAPIDRAQKVRSQQERQAMAYILVRQATSLLQRTRLHVTITCQAWHSKHARHMILDIVDFLAPTLLIVGSRGLGELRGILLGSTSHYLVQRSAAPVMVARRRLRRPPRGNAHLDPRRAQPRVKLAEAGIDRVASRVDQDVAHMREEVAEDEERRDNRAPPPSAPDEDDEDEDADVEVEGRKVAGD